MNNITQIFELIDEGSFKKADMLCNELEDTQQENPAFHVARLMIEMQARNANQIKARLPMYIDSENYLKAVRYDDGQFGELLKYNKRKAKKYTRKKKKKGVWLIVVIALLVATIASYKFLLPYANYSRAEKLCDSGDYQKSAEIFNSLGDYKDSRERYEEAVFLAARGLYDEGDISGCLNELVKVGMGQSEQSLRLGYDCAMHAMNSMSFIEAATAFDMLGDYLDSEQKLHNCYLYFACYLSDSGDRDGALKTLSDIGLTEDDIFDMKYDHGLFMLDHQEFYEAKLHFAMLGDYRDCVMKVDYIDSISGECEYTVKSDSDDEEPLVFTLYSEAFEAALAGDDCHIYDQLGIMLY